MSNTVDKEEARDQVGDSITLLKDVAQEFNIIEEAHK